MGFTGSVPHTICRVLSGVDCNEQVTPDDERCPRGHDLLPREYEQQVTAPARSRVVHRHPLREQFDYATLESDAEVRERLASQPSNLYVTRRAVEEFESHHGVAQDEARGELFVLVEKALETGTMVRLEGGYFRLRYEKFDAILDPGASALVAYRTRHYERTPTEVARGIESRFGRQANLYTRSGPVLRPEELLGKATAGWSVDDRFLQRHARRIKRTPESAAAELITELRSIHSTAEWNLSENAQTYVVTNSSRRYRLAADRPLLLAAWAVRAEVD